MSTIKEEAWNWIDTHAEEFTEVADEVWKYAELGLVETRSSKLIAGVLRDHGFKVEQGVSGMPTAIFAVWGEGKPTLGFQGEYDALPGIGHAKIYPPA